MGKQRRDRLKFHIAAAKKEKQAKEITNNTDSQPMTLVPPDNLFAGINIDLVNLRKDLGTDTQSVKSFKSSKSQTEKPILPKKDKLKLRHKTLLRKIDTVNAMKLEAKRRKKRKNVAIIGDTNALHDALPTLEPAKCKPIADLRKTKPKGTPKASIRKKQAVQGVKLFKMLINNKSFQKNPLKVVSDHINTMVQKNKQEH